MVFSKNIIKKKKEIHKVDIIRHLNCTKKNTKIFWKINFNLREDTFKSGISGNWWLNHFKSGISGNWWLNHFQSIFTSEKTFSYPNNPNTRGPLDYKITNQELDDASYTLKPGKSLGDR